MSLPMPSLRVRRAAPEPVANSRLVRLGWLVLGSLIVLAGVVIAPVPGPGGIPVIALGLTVILRHSRAAKRAFIRAQRRWPRAVSPVRRLLQRKRAVQATQVPEPALLLQAA